MTTNLDAPARPASRWLRASSLALLASICVNVALTSYLAVQALRSASHATRVEREEGNPENMVRRFADRLPSADAEILWQVYRAKETPIRGAIAAAQAARIRALSVLAQPNLDAAALQASIKEAMDSRVRAAQLLSETIIEALERISPEGRVAIAKQYRQ